LSPANANTQSDAFPWDTNPLRTARFAYATTAAYTYRNPFTPGHANSNAHTYAITYAV
jgi:hypothetical protein